MFKTLSGRLSASFNVDGGHLHRYLERGRHVTQTICEELLLHDEIVIPTQDYLTACGLALILGERALIELLERKRISFIRLRGAFGYGRGTGQDGALVTFEDPNRKRPQDSDVESSVKAGLQVISEKLKDKKKLQDLLIQHSSSIELSHVVDSIKHDSYDDLKGTRLWKAEFEIPNKDLLALPGMEQMQVRVIGPGRRPKEDAVDALLALAQYNIELYLSQTLSCNTISSSSPLGDLLEIKVRRIVPEASASVKLWTLLEVNNIPDLGAVSFSSGPLFSDFLRVCSTQHANDFRAWFHNGKDLNEREILREYVGLLQEMPWVQRLPFKMLRFVVTNGLGFIPVVGQVVSFIDTFVIEHIFRGRSPRFLINDLRDFYGRIKLKQVILPGAQNDASR